MNTDDHARKFLCDLFEKTVDKSTGACELLHHLPPPAAHGKTILLALGKAASQMAATAAEFYGQNVSGLVVTRLGYNTRADKLSHFPMLEVIEAGHPVPDRESLLAGRKLLDLAHGATADDQVIFLISGGGSALASVPVEGLSFEDKQNIHRHLVHSGAPIADINFIRKHLSEIKGGLLAVAAAPAECHTFIISDVVGDAPGDIASGPSVGFKRSGGRALDMLQAYGYSTSEHIANAIKNSDKLPGAQVHPVHIVASARDALGFVEGQMVKAGFTVVNLGFDLEGEASVIGQEHARFLTHYSKKTGRFALISGGELTVTVRNANGRGGPNLEYLTALANSVSSDIEFCALACDTDGIDGSEENAGGYLSSTNLKRAKDVGLSADHALSNNDTWSYFKALDGLVHTGPTGTNVNDLRILLTGTDFKLGDDFPIVSGDHS